MEEDRIQQDLEREIMGDDGGMDALLQGVSIHLGGNSSHAATPPASAPPSSVDFINDISLDDDDMVDENQNAASIAAIRDHYHEDILAVLGSIDDPFNFSSPAPDVRELVLVFQGQSFRWNRYDYGISFLSFLPTLAPELQISAVACETNRCFFLHLGLAAGIHPFAMQEAFRTRARIGLRELSADDFAQVVVNTVLEPSGLVDANALAFLWPKEFSRKRVCLMSGPLSRPLFMVFTPTDCDESELTDILMRCEGDHFTLLGPQRQGELTRLVEVAKAARLVVMETVVKSESFGAAEGGFSIHETLSQMMVS